MVALVIGGYLARTLFASTLLFGADRDSAAICLTIHVESERAATNVPQLLRAQGWNDSVMPAGARQPVTARGVARCIGLPTETVGRKINRLIEKRLIERVPGGLLLIRIPAVARIHALQVYHELLAMLVQVKAVVAIGWTRTSTVTVPSPSRMARG